ncbi:MAG: phosphomannose isomerase type II C-terminal cupin domain [Elusimicrobia bacterium]|nr:phosphomannose isomerase type II C-terminal cupin domain [Elusimicrobiota bacterium]
MLETSGEDRPWGRWDVLHEEPGAKVKRILVRPGQRLSYQTHARREERWTVVRGQARVTLDEKDTTLGAGDMISVPLGAAHRLANPGTVDLVIIELQLGSYLGEDDIKRLSDDYGRGGKPE